MANPLVLKLEGRDRLSPEERHALEVAPSDVQTFASEETIVYQVRR